jgi:hypothetical protein
MYHHRTDPLQASHSPDVDPLRCIITALTHAKASLTTAFVRIFHGMAEYLRAAYAEIQARRKQSKQ